jgi:hypothetical protein
MIFGGGNYIFSCFRELMLQFFTSVWERWNCPCAFHEGLQEKRTCIVTRSLTRPCMEVTGRIHAPVFLQQGKEPPVPFEYKRLGGPQSPSSLSEKEKKNSFPVGNLTPDSSVDSVFTIPTVLPWFFPFGRAWSCALFTGYFLAMLCVYNVGTHVSVRLYFCLLLFLSYFPSYFNKWNIFV